jgi:Flp pilus assembly protein TadB
MRAAENTFDNMVYCQNTTTDMINNILIRASGSPKEGKHNSLWFFVVLCAWLCLCLCVACVAVSAVSACAAVVRACVCCAVLCCLCVRVRRNQQTTNLNPNSAYNRTKIAYRDHGSDSTPWGLSLRNLWVKYCTVKGISQLT